jgi:solute carrier family 30 (zinc transporter), member 9
MPFFRYVRERADPATVAILLEDGAAVLGLVLAAIGISAAHVTGNPVFDSLASILVGVVLGGVAIYLVQENRALLLGKAVPDEVEARFLEVLRGWRSVRSVQDVKTRQLTPEAFKLRAEHRSVRLRPQRGPLPDGRRLLQPARQPGQVDGDLRRHTARCTYPS